MVQHHSPRCPVSCANAWWIALPDITKIAIYDDLMEISENERVAG